MTTSLILVQCLVPAKERIATSDELCAWSVCLHIAAIRVLGIWLKESSGYI